MGPETGKLSTWQIPTSKAWSNRLGGGSGGKKKKGQGGYVVGR